MLMKLKSSNLSFLCLPFFVTSPINMNMKNRILAFAIGVAFFRVAAFSLPAIPCKEILHENQNRDLPLFGGLGPKPTQLPDMANTLLRYSPRNDERQVQVAFPVLLQKNDIQPQQFGDGQQNAYASFGSLKQQPFTAILSRSSSVGEKAELAFVISPDLGSTAMTELEISIFGLKSSLFKNSDGHFILPIDTAKMKWDQMHGAEPVYFRPKGWKDWFVVTFPQTYVSIHELVSGMAEPLTKIVSGDKTFSIVDPLALAEKVKNGMSITDAVIEVDSSADLGFKFARIEGRVHGEYWFTNEQGPKVATATGGATTRYREAALFKEVYLVQDARNLGTETAQGVVSGTGPYAIGANGEIIVHSIGNEPLMTFFGFHMPKTGPDGEAIAWADELGSQWIGTWLKPGQAFITPRGDFHWHLTHDTKAIGAQVWTPVEVPNAQNHYGYPKK